MKKCFILFLILIPFAAQAFDWYLEPSLGYQLWGNQKQSVANTSYEWSYHAPELGLKAGLGGLGFAGGISAIQTLNFTKTLEKPAPKSSEEMNARHLGVFGSFRFPFLLKLYAAYYFISDYKFKAGPSRNQSLKGNGLAVGAGYGIFFVFDLNVEFRDVTLEKLGGTDLADKIAARELIFSVSVPFSI